MVSTHPRGLPDQGDCVRLQTGSQAAAFHYFHNACRAPLAFLHSQHLDCWSEIKVPFLSFKLAIVFCCCCFLNPSSQKKCWQRGVFFLIVRFLVHVLLAREMSANIVCCLTITFTVLKDWTNILLRLQLCWAIPSKGSTFAMNDQFFDLLIYPLIKG